VDLLEEVIFLHSELNLLGVEHRSELGGGKNTFTEEIVVLEELEKANTVLLDHLLDFRHEFIKSLASTVVNEIGAVSALGSGVRTVNVKDEDVAVLEEVGVTNFASGSALAAVDFCNASNLSFVQREAMSGEDLAENLGSHLEVTVLVEILEEGLSVKAVFANNFLEAENNVVNAGNFLISGIMTTVDGFGFGIIEDGIDILLKVFLSKDLIDSITELTPVDVLSFLRGLEGCGDELELGVADNDLGHGKTNAELSAGDESGSKFIKVTEEFTNSDSLLRTKLTNASKNILNVIRGVADNFSLGNSGLGLGEVVERVVEVATNTEEFLAAINIIAEINVVNFINISLVHVATEESLCNCVRGADLKEVNHTEELLLSDMTVLGNIKVLENGLQKNTASGNSLFVLGKNGFEVDIGLGFKVFAASKDCLILCHGGNASGGVFLDAVSSEGFVD